MSGDNIYNNEVTTQLGPNGLPITWWIPSMNSQIIGTGTGTTSLPYSNMALYPPNSAGGQGFNGEGQA